MWGLRESLFYGKGRWAIVLLGGREQEFHFLLKMCLPTLMRKEKNLKRGPKISVIDEGVNEKTERMNHVRKHVQACTTSLHP